MRCVGLERQVAELIDDQELWPRQDCQLFVQRAVSMRLGEHCDQRRGRDELDAVVLPDSLAAEGHGKMSFARARRPQEQDRIAMCNPATGRQIT